MRTREPDDPAERAIDAALDEEAQRAESEASGHVPPSFAAMVARAHRIDPRAVGVDAIERAGKITRVPHRRAAVADADELAPMIAALQADAERDIHRRSRDGVPPYDHRITRDGQRQAAHTRRWIAGLCAFAAAATVVLGLDWLESWSARRHDEVRDSTQSVSAVRDGPVVHDAEHLEPAVIEPARIVVERRPMAEPAQIAVLPEEPAPLEAPVMPAEVLAVPRAAKAKVPADAVLRRLDAEAQAAAARGDRSAADALYGELIERGRRHPLVEIAFAERFSLARGRGVAAQRGLWAAYLVKFPEGRFADDAHAGGCRTAAAADKATCWRDYAERFPAGAYRQHADRWLLSTATP